VFIARHHDISGWIGKGETAMRPEYDVAIVGGGFFGCMIAEHLRQSHARVVLLEANDRLLGRASYHNQARVHNGYHYPRSPLTAYRSRINFPRFVAQFEDCVVADFEKYYAVARTLSKVTAHQFRLVYDRIGAPIARAPGHIRRLFNPKLIEEVFTVQEFAFNADKLAARMAGALEESGVEVRLGWEVRALESLDRGPIAVTCMTPSGLQRTTAGQVFNCTYARLNQVLSDSGLPTIGLKHELTEMALVAVPEELRELGITVMCGPFFSVMPFPARGLHTLSHVRYTPHESWSDAGKLDRDPYEYLERTPRRSNFSYMLRDARRFLPALRDSVHVDSLWEIKTILPASESNDSRPILMRSHCGMANLHCVLGAKIDNIYDALDAIDLIAQTRRAG
jgi:glycine/D-amino acid oxidase-like deaminating enzyme